MPNKIAYDNLSKYEIDTGINLFSNTHVVPMIEKQVENLKGLSLDYGCGTTSHADIGIDLSKKSIKKAHEKGFNVLVTDGEYLPFRNGVFTLVYTIGVLHHIPEWWDKAVKEIVRVTKKGGYVCGYEPNLLYPHVSNFIHMKNIADVQPEEKSINPKMLMQAYEENGFKFTYTNYIFGLKIFFMFLEYLDLPLPFKCNIYHSILSLDHLTPYWFRELFMYCAKKE